jgi:hypothetical protein
LFSLSFAGVIHLLVPWLGISIWFKRKVALFPFPVITFRERGEGSFQKSIPSQYLETLCPYWKWKSWNASGKGNYYVGEGEKRAFLPSSILRKLCSSSLYIIPICWFFSLSIFDVYIRIRIILKKYIWKGDKIKNCSEVKTYKNFIFFTTTKLGSPVLHPPKQLESNESEFEGCRRAKNPPRLVELHDRLAMGKVEGQPETLSCSFNSRIHFL